MAHPKISVMRTILVATILSIVSASLNAKRPISDRQKVTGMSQSSRQQTNVFRGALHFPSPSVMTDSTVLRGFDKPSSSDMETLFVTNSASRTLCGIGLEITYLSMSGEMLHQRKMTQELLIPPHETRKCDFRSFDRSKSFYYLHSSPGRSGAAPFDVKIRITDLYYNR